MSKTISIFVLGVFGAAIAVLWYMAKDLGL